MEQELAKKRGKDSGKPVEEVKPAEDELYIIPEHLKVTSEHLLRSLE